MRARALAAATGIAVAAGMVLAASPGTAFADGTHPPDHCAAPTGNGPSVPTSLYNGPFAEDAPWGDDGTPIQVFVGQTATLAGYLYCAPVGAKVQITRKSANGTSAVVGTVTSTPIDSLGATWSFDDSQPAGNYTYTAAYLGDDTYLPSDGTRVMRFVRHPVSIKVTANAPKFELGKANRVTVTGQLTSAEGLAIPKGQKLGVRLALNPANGAPGTPLAPAVTTDTAGHFAFPMDIRAEGKYQLQLSYPGTADLSGASATADLNMTRLTPQLTVQTDRALYGFKAKATVTAHLGTTYTGRTVGLYATPVNGKRVTIRTAKVDKNGNISGTYVVSRSTRFSATFAGDSRYAPASASVGTKTTALIHGTAGGYLRTTTSGGQTYKVYHHTSSAKFAVDVAPAAPGQCVRVQRQTLTAGAWIGGDIDRSICVKLNSKSAAAYSMALGTMNQSRVRVRFLYDTVYNAPTYSAWQYIAVVN
ncbi:hypothetical protein [Streptomyces sp. MI02-7b]|uniref:hypothetical protein n=1 Tax=Streptomyces sp. MI02-7b TaxID=462941 RepID=UPI0029AAE583|nr:hypothetical protein [Streptomyces sp. MI02-7b]MDX3076803.1 hypothetical protein [Streptomyces sp. MI02-7b]